MILTAAETQLIHILRAAGDHDLTLTIRVRDHRYAVGLASHDSGPGIGIGSGETFDAAWENITAQEN